MISHVTRLVSVLCLFETGVMGDARLCTFEINGESKYYVCPRNEYCCKVGCCLSPSFQFYQLWYYWLMVIFMLVVCSGGQWWYKYWVGGGGEVTRSNGPHVLHRGQQSSSTAPPPTAPRSQPMTASATATASSSSSAPPSFTLIHQICKPHHYHSRGEGKVLSPYEQIYGPPPSYESVVGNGLPSSVLPAYSPSPEPSSSTAQQNVGSSATVRGEAASSSVSDPLGALDQITLRGDCPTYSESEATCRTAGTETHRIQSNYQQQASPSLRSEPSPSRSSLSTSETSTTSGISHRDGPSHHRDINTNHRDNLSHHRDSDTANHRDNASLCAAEPSPSHSASESISSHRDSPSHNRRSSSHRDSDTTMASCESQTPPTVRRSSQCLDHQQH